MYPDSLPSNFNGSVTGQKMFNVRRYSMYTGVLIWDVPLYMVWQLLGTT